MTIHRGLLLVSVVLPAILVFGGVLGKACASDATVVEHVAKWPTPYGQGLGTDFYSPSRAERPFFEKLDAKEKASGRGSEEYRLDDKGRKFVGWFGIVRKVAEDAEHKQTVLTVEHKYFDGLTDGHILAVSFNGGGDFRTVLRGVGHEIAPLSLVKVYGVPVEGGEAGLPRVDAGFVRDWHWGTFTFLSDYGKQKGSEAWRRLNQVELQQIYDPYPTLSYYEERLGKRTADDPLYRRLLRPAGKLTPKTKRLMIELIDSLQAKDLFPVMRMIDIIPRRHEERAAVAVLLAAIADEEIPGFATAVALGRLAGPDVAPPLVELLGNANPDMRCRAAEALSEMHGKVAMAVPALVKALRDAEPKVRSSAAGALCMIGDRAAAAAGPLKECLKDRDGNVRLAAAEALWRITSEIEPSISVIIGELKGADAARRSAAGTILERMGETAASAVPALIAATRDTDASVRYSAVVALGVIRSDAKTAAPALAAALKDEDSYVRTQAAEALGHYGPAAQTAVPSLVTALKDEDGSVRWQAAETLGTIGPAAAKAIPSLIQMLRSDEEEMPRWKSAESLVLIDVGGRESISVLTQAVTDKFPLVRRSAIEGLGKIGAKAKSALPAVRAAIKDNDEAVRIGAAEALWTIDGDIDTALPVLLEALEGDGYLSLAASAIGTIGAPAKAAVPSLIKLLGPVNGNVQNCAATALGSIGPDAAAAVPALVGMLQLRDGSYPCAVDAAEALWKINRHPRAIPVLIEILKSDDGMTAAAEALGRIGPAASEAIPALRQLAKDSDPEIRKLASDALRKVSISRD